MKTRVWGVFALCAGLVSGVQAAELLSFGGGSLHFERDLGHNEFNYGLGYERDWSEDISWSVGVYKNSIRRATFYGLANWYPWAWDSGIRAGLSGGLMTGYHKSPVIGTLMPTLEWRGERLALQAYVVPTIKPYVDGAVVVQVKYQFRR
ncbi:MAG: hypothetical protein CGU28_05670 [Candidatus Dactylopiibacterium carminicum]|uniref:Uncharacterized protein n=1 Tax=Candidatus Dactylopiibacterium carminicum TaxID=857335 RepID=A0A272EV10_9RHOO|nr:hypothetical protein [Candidatus Dactylopiibacterium carminicum]KAF7599821.1 hypothetical protein BGI27_05720 [Candidatus Dactylopiibacterium carminicum]PAS93932.1 MAG: hypothetical protein CGU29_05725 [Candidatus Dactylopiibacterium carminicum]PAS97247.1 MAG: hypothetical protein CGU28_05670 [Candidatus Dactylopiibacterium carminicum]PAS99823.1 MAG: hypothetical protein BSR46_05755 [Candidatus Dactylopiibacterium carminicum]